MELHAINTDGAPSGRGNYSQAIIAGGFVFCSGTVGLDSVSGEWPDGIEAQTELALKNLEAVLAAAGSSVELCVKVTVFLTDAAHAPIVNEIYRRHMPDPPPARSAPVVGGFPVPEALISIDAIATLKET
ncbi:MAG TPA: RidA family protein [Candidatus Solibacter sp.]|jgi:2-iminobutanoate/2-iminopropanoate deaminase|nr:RidA family protein [Candidatus Solibacter sp.]